MGTYRVTEEMDSSGDAIYVGGLTPEGLYLDDPGAISTRSLRRVNPLTMTADDVDVSDIARALSAQCRYNGHCFGHLSVARHCIWVAEALVDLGPFYALCGLLHDAAEAYLGDLVRPLKHTAFGERYLEIEYYAEHVIFGRFGLPYPLPPEVAEADRTVLTRELHGERWTYDGNARDDEAEFLATYDLLVSVVMGDPSEITRVIDHAESE